MKDKTSNLVTGGEAILRSLKLNGIDYLFINPGSDFAPIIEALAGAHASEIPEAIACAHENVVVSMAHGYYLATGKMQAVKYKTVRKKDYLESALAKGGVILAK